MINMEFDDEVILADLEIYSLYYNRGIATSFIILGSLMYPTKFALKMCFSTLDLALKHFQCLLVMMHEQPQLSSPSLLVSF